MKNAGLRQRIKERILTHTHNQREQKGKIQTHFKTQEKTGFTERRKEMWGEKSKIN